jgi:hypothetical protein
VGSAGLFFRTVSIFRLQPCLAALTVVVTIAVYWPGIHGGFIFDDFVNIVDNSKLKIKDLSPTELIRAADSGTAGPTKRPISMISFALNVYLGGLSPFQFKLTNLLIHILNGILIFALGRVCLEARGVFGKDLAAKIALATSAAWLLHPLNLTSVLYVVQRMSSLSTLFTLLALCGYVYVRSGRYGSRSVFAAIGLLMLFTALATLCKENGILTLAYALVIEFCFLGFRTVDRSSRTLLVAFFVLIILVGIGLNLLVLTVWKDWLDAAYMSRYFTLSERILTESRALFFYLKMLVVPNIKDFGIYHDDFIVSKSLFDPPTTLISCIAILALIFTALMLKKRVALLSFAILWYFAGHLMESTYLPLELVHEHRTYLANFSPLLLVCSIFFSPPKNLLTVAAWRYMGIGFISILTVVTLIRSDQWENPLVHAALEAAHHPDSYRANYEIGMLLVTHNVDHDPEYYDRAVSHFAKATSINSYRQKALFAIIQTDFIRGQRPDPAIINVLTTRLRTGPFQLAEDVDFDAFVRCIKKNVCQLDEGIVRSIFTAALNNPTVQKEARARVWNVYGIYLAEILKNYEEARVSFHKAAEEYPSDLRYRANEIMMLITPGEKQAAASELREARTLDKWGRMESSFSELQALIESP